MKERSVSEIEAFCKELWKKSFFYDEGCQHPRVNPPTIVARIDKASGRAYVTVEMMYESPGLSFQKLQALATFFETMNIDDARRFSNPGCETCDYGSSYGFTLEVRP